MFSPLVMCVNERRDPIALLGFSIYVPLPSFAPNQPQEYISTIVYALSRRLLLNPPQYLI